MIIINTNPTVAVVSEPKRLILASQHKVGKTRLCMQLPKSFLIDGEDSSDHFSGGASFNVIKEQASGRHTKSIPIHDPTTGTQKVNDKGVPQFKNVKLTQTELLLTEIPSTLRDMNTKNGGIPIFDFGIIDTLTFLEGLARGLATKNYKTTLVGRSFKGTDVVSELANGGGYDWHRKAVQLILAAYEGLFGKCLILTAHIKDASILRNDGSTTDLGRELAATGLLRTLLPAKFDATGYMYRSKNPNENILSFVTKESDKSTGARNPHLTGKEFVISKYHPDTDTLDTFWEQVFPSISKKI